MPKSTCLNSRIKSQHIFNVLFLLAWYRKEPVKAKQWVHLLVDKNCMFSHLDVVPPLVGDVPFKQIITKLNWATNPGITKWTCQPTRLLCWIQKILHPNNPVHLPFLIIDRNSHWGSWMKSEIFARSMNAYALLGKLLRYQLVSWSPSPAFSDWCFCGEPGAKRSFKL